MFDIETAYQDWRRGHDQVRNWRKVFVVGCAKSGTTWLADLLDSHEHMVVQGEGCFTWQLVPILAQAFRVFNEHQKQMKPLVQLRDLDLLLVARTMIDSQFHRYVIESGRDPGRIRMVGDKTPQHSISIPLLHQLYPDAMFVHIIRDPRDTATSAWFHFGKNDNRSLADYIEHFVTQAWPLNVVKAREAGRQIPAQYTEVRYEDLLGDPAGHLRRVLEFLGMDASEQAVQRCVDSASFEKKSGGRRPGQKDNHSFYRSGTSGDWRNHLPVDLARQCCTKIAPVMNAFGYDPTCEAAATGK